MMLNRQTSFEYDIEPDSREVITVYNRDGIGNRTEWDRVFKAIIDAVEHEAKMRMGSNFKIRVSFEEA